MQHGRYTFILSLLALFFISSCSTSQKAIVINTPKTTDTQTIIETSGNHENIASQKANTAVIINPADTGDTKQEVDVSSNKDVEEKQEALEDEKETVVEDIKTTAVSDKTAAEPAKTGISYIIGAGDLLEISAWRDDALTKTLIVLPDGKISFPLIGQIIAAGKTIDQLKQEMTEKISPYVPEPVVSIEVKQANSMLIYVIGRVNNPGRFPVNAYVNVLQALSIAGGLNPFAKSNKIKIFRTDGDKTHIFKFRYDDVADGNKLEQNIQIKNGDVIVVP
ncbi:MAG: polysaccharide biosynthesis/export family protein [Proteobacteria bacterium]|nr:polysaccharide biosynthesis/export family protein [Pseudomonadota bacterium]